MDRHLKEDLRHIWDMVDAFLIWLNKNGYYSYDQYDYWNTAYGKLAKRLYYKKIYLGAPLVVPIFLLELFFPYSRKLVVDKKRFPIADSHFIMGNVNLFKVTRYNKFLDEAIIISDELLKSAIPGYSGYCWGYPFDWQTNRGLIKKGTPLITTVPYCFEAFLSLYDFTKEEKYLEVAHSISQFVLNDLNESVISDMSSACSYSPIDNGKIVNANAYRAFCLMEAYHRFGADGLKEKAVKNLNFVLDNQYIDGSWLYAVDNPHNAFVDNFHTCFILKNLYKANVYLKSSKVNNAIIKGYNFYRNNLFADKDVPKPYAILRRTQLVQVEMYDYAEGISLGVLLKDEIPGAFELAKKLVRDVYLYYQLPDGHFITRLNLGGLRNTVPYLRWPQSQMFFALTTLLNNIDND